MPRDYEVKITRNTMTVMISNGLSKQSSKIFKISLIFYFYVILFYRTKSS